jgi:hypothetical protein
MTIYCRERDYLPFPNPIFNTEPLTLIELAMASLPVLLVFAAHRKEKKMVKRKSAI